MIEGLTTSALLGDVEIVDVEVTDMILVSSEARKIKLVVDIWYLPGAPEPGVWLGFLPRAIWFLPDYRLLRKVKDIWKQESQRERGAFITVSEYPHITWCIHQW